MKYKLFLLILLVSKISYAQNENLSNEKIANINNVIALFKQKKNVKIVKNVNFPLKREYPITSIKDKNELKKRFDEVFDDILIEKIANSKIEQWSEVGWRGITLNNGIIWIDSYDGKITAVNYQSDFEKNLKTNLIEKEKDNLYVTLKIFEAPTYKIKTKKYLIRIDELSNNKYRYASWKVSDLETSKPDIILNNGELEFEGSGGNHVINFINKNYTYKVYRNLIGEKNMPDFTIEVEKDGEVILTQDGTFLTK